MMCVTQYDDGTGTYRTYKPYENIACMQKREYEELAKVLIRAEPKKVIRINTPLYQDEKYLCPNCKNRILPVKIREIHQLGIEPDFMPGFCYFCGQNLDWRNEEIVMYVAKKI